MITTVDRPGTTEVSSNRIKTHGQIVDKQQVQETDFGNDRIWEVEVLHPPTP